jgi:hypothetical protein
LARRGEFVLVPLAIVKRERVTLAPVGTGDGEAGGAVEAAGEEDDGAGRGGHAGSKGVYTCHRSPLL